MFEGVRNTKSMKLMIFLPLSRLSILTWCGNLFSFIQRFVGKFIRWQTKDFTQIDTSNPLVLLKCNFNGRTFSILSIFKQKKTKTIKTFLKIQRRRKRKRLNKQKLKTKMMTMETGKMPKKKKINYQPNRKSQIEIENPSQ